MKIFQELEQEKGVLMRMIPFKDGRTFFINPDKNIDFDKKVITFHISGEEKKLIYHKDIPFKIDVQGEQEIILPLGEDNKPMFGLFKEMIFNGVSDNSEHELELLFIYEQIQEIYEKSPNKKDFKQLFTFFENLGITEK